MPRWVIIGMWTTSLLAVLVAAGWWWVTWPERIAVSFCDALEKEDWSAANRLILRSPEFTPLVIMDVGGITQPAATRPLALKRMPRSLLDVVLARQEFQISERHGIHVKRGVVQESHVGLILLMLALNDHAASWHSNP